MECKISKIITHDNRPLIVKYQNGQLNLHKEKLNTKTFRDNGNNVVSQIEGQDTLYKGSVAEDCTKNTFIMVRKKDSNKVTLIQVDRAILSPYIQRIHDVTDNPLENKLSRRDLYKEFGSKKAKRQTEQFERMKMDVEHVRDQLEKTVADIEIEDSSFVPPVIDENENTYRPPINRNASTKEQVYDIERILPKSVLDSLANDVQNVLEVDIEQFNFNPVIKRTVLELQKSVSPSRIKKCAILLYVDCLINFLSTPANRLTKNYIACSYCTDVNSHILNNFSLTSGNSRTRPMTLRDKCICYILVLLMIALDFKLVIEDLAKEVKLGLKKLQEVGRVLGFTVIGNTFVLKIPLPPPVTNPADRKRKRK